MSEWREAGYPLMRKSTHKLKIWKPTFRKTEPDAAPDPASSQNPKQHASLEIYDGNGQLISSTERTLAGFMLVPVVDISQLQNVPQSEPRPPR